MGEQHPRGEKFKIQAYRNTLSISVGLWDLEKIAAFSNFVSTYKKKSSFFDRASPVSRIEHANLHSVTGQTL